MAEPRSQTQLLEDICRKLDLLVGVTLVAGRPEHTQIELLRTMGHDWNTIGAIVGMKPAAAAKRFERMSKSMPKKSPPRATAKSKRKG